MQKINKNIFLISLFFIFINCDQAIQSKDSSNSIVVVKVFSSLTCPHCADFHGTIYKKLKNEYIDVGRVKFEHHAFPLDLAALNAEVIVRCQDTNEKKFEVLTEMYNRQTAWAVGSDINKINELIKKVGLEFDLSNEKMNMCLKDDQAQDEILEQRIEAQKKYKIESTPTIIINEKKYSGKIDYNQFKKFIDKKL